MKVCIYAITKNEIKHVERFMASTKGADAVYVTDTGSEDGTPEALRKLGAIVSEYTVNWGDWPKKSQTKEWKDRLKRPWRFDIARNKSLFCIDKDMDWCICLDLDEVLHDGWRQHFERAVQQNPGATRMRYKYIWNHKADNSPDVVYWGDKIHLRKDYKWHHPVHEVLMYTGKKHEVQQFCDLVIEHWPDNTKSRGQYFPLLELAVYEDPEDDRNAHYLGREYFFNRMWDKAKKELMRHLSLPRAQWRAERARSMQYIAKCALYQGDMKECIAWMRRACAEDPDSRDTWMDLAQAELDRGDHLGGYHAAKQALKITDRVPTYMSTSRVWEEWPHDVAGTCACYIGLLHESRKHTRKAWKRARKDQRIIGNYKFVKRESAPGIDPIRPKYHIFSMRDNADNWADKASDVVVHYHVPSDNTFRAIYDIIVRISQTSSKPEPGDVIIVDLGETNPPKDWDKWLFEEFTDFPGCILANIGDYPDSLVKLPILDFGCLVRLNNIIYHPSYVSSYADVELFDILHELKLLKDMRQKGPRFSHSCPDRQVLQEDIENYRRRSKLSVGERLQT